MKKLIKLIDSPCAICGKDNDFSILYKENFDLDSVDSKVFSARRIPDRLHFQIVKCNSCGLVRSNPIIPLQYLKKLYKESKFTYGEEVKNLQLTYGSYLKRLDDYGALKGKLLEIGCGNGFFLKQALELGYKEVWGVEPSKDAISKASAKLKNHIVCDIFRPGIFTPNQFNVICFFQVLDHIVDPNQFLSECYQILKPGGLILCINHDIGAWTAGILKDKSPIIDVEHTYLYDKKTIKKIFEKNKFRVLDTGNVRNIYSLGYWLQMTPLPLRIKKILIKKRHKFLRLKLTLGVGNLYLIARK